MSKIIQTNHGVVQTPFFMPDATRGVVKSLGKKDLEGVGVRAMVVNTYHLLLEPGMNVIKKMGGVHAFMNWKGPLLSDSGGYQVFSLIHKRSDVHRRNLSSSPPKAGTVGWDADKHERDQGGLVGKITDDGAIFQSPLDGSRHELTPEKSIQIQFDLGVDMMVVLDDCPPNDAPKADIERAVERTIKWAKRCDREYERQLKKRKTGRGNGFKPFSPPGPLLFCVVQGGVYKDLRKQCIEGLKEIRDWDGYGFGARHVDGEGNVFGDILAYTARVIPIDRLRFALGIGTPSDTVECVEMGWDMFDCVIPTREARHRRLYKFEIRNSKSETNSKFQIPNSKHPTLNLPLVRGGGRRGKSFYEILNISNAKYKTDKNPVDEHCDCELCQNYSAGYLYHLFKVGDPLSLRLASIHNLRFYMKLMEALRLR